MAEVRQIRVPWATLWKVLALVALVWIWLRLWRLVMLVIIAIIIAIGLSPVVAWLERKRLPRWLAAAVATLAVVATIVTFLVFAWSELSSQMGALGQRLGEIEKLVTERAPQWFADLIRTGSKPDASAVTTYLAWGGRFAVGAVGVFVLAFILVFYFLIEGRQSYEWVRHFVPERHKKRFDRTARDAFEAARGYVVGNVVTSACAGLYVYVVTTALGIPASLLLALLAFIFDFIPVLGFVLSVVPAMVMAATVSPTMALAMIPVYLFYDFLENYFIAPRVYGDKLELSKLAVLLAFAVGAELAGVVGALLSLPLAALVPTIDRVWLRRARFSQEEDDDA